MSPGVLAAFAFLFGACIGSFANVCIHRLPLDLSIVRPRSRCVRCGQTIAWYDNLPVLSFLRLRGRCRACGTPFGVRYLCIELLCGFGAAWIVHRHGVGFGSLYAYLLGVALLVAAAVDLEHRIIPDEISLTGATLGLLTAALATWWRFPWPVDLTGAGIGAASGFAIVWATGWLYERLKGREGIGMGDAKLLALFGAHAGVPGVLSALLYGSLTGALVGGAAILWAGKDRRTPIPFGPFLTLGFAAQVVFGDRALDAPVEWLSRLFA